MVYIICFCIYLFIQLDRKQASWQSHLKAEKYNTRTFVQVFSLSFVMYSKYFATEANSSEEEYGELDSGKSAE